jgi:hypothetical protein
MGKIRYVVRRGRAAGAVLTPHLHEDGHFVVSRTRFEKDYVRVRSEDALLYWIRDGYSVRMSNPKVASHRSPSLIAPSSLEPFERESVA